MIGWIYRRAVAVKEFGERLAHKRIFGIRPLYWLSGPIICIGLVLRDWVSKYPIH